MPDPAQDPDRYDATKDAAAPGPLDPARDPDRFRSPTLPGLLGEGSQEGERDGATWLIGLVSVFAFLILISVLVSLRT